VRGCQVSYISERYHCFECTCTIEEESDDSKDSSWEELKQVFDHFAKYYMKILLRYLNTVLGRQNMFKPAIGNESPHQDTNNNNGDKLVKSRCSRTETFINTPGLLLVGRRTNRLIIY
jgi:hypothetical protein